MTDDSARLRDELAQLSTERLDPALRDVDTWPTLEMVRAMNARDATVPAAVGAAERSVADAVDAIATRMRAGGRLIYAGAGTAGRLGVLDASECPPTFGTDPALVVGLIAGGESAVRHAVEDSEDDMDSAAADARALSLTRDDAVVGISASGRTPYVLAMLDAAGDAGALRVAVACNTGSALCAHADIAVEVDVGPEFIAGSTRLGAGTAQKLVLNMISTLVMVRLGKTYGNVMVDLQATNSKLRARSERTVMDITGLDAHASADVLARADGSVKLAIMMALSGADADAARSALDAAGGHLRTALNRRTGRGSHRR